MINNRKFRNKYPKVDFKTYSEIAYLVSELFFFGLLHSKRKNPGDRENPVEKNHESLGFKSGSRSPGFRDFSN